MPISGGFPDFGEELADRLIRVVAERTRGRLCDLRVEREAGRIVVRGRADCHHVRQVALQAVGEVGGSAVVELDIRVGRSRPGAEESAHR